MRAVFALFFLFFFFFSSFFLSDLVGEGMVHTCESLCVGGVKVCVIAQLTVRKNARVSYKVFRVISCD